MGATGGVEPSEEDRKKKVEGVERDSESKISSKFSRLFSSTFESDWKENSAAYKEALRDILEPASAPDKVEQIVREGFLQCTIPTSTLVECVQ